MKYIKITTYLVVILIANSAFSADYLVPQEYDTIQAAINACDDSDTVVIAPGRHYGAGNCNMNLRGKAITVRSTDPTNLQIVNDTVIDCEGKGGFIFYMGENENSKIAGLTITNGYAFLGGAIYCYNNSSPTITNCVFINNSAVFGGAIVCSNSQSCPNITNCIITANSVLVGGGAIYCNGASPKIRNCLISGNFAPTGGAIYSHNTGEPIIINCTISGNASSKSAAGIYCYKSSNLIINNSILWGNTAPYASEILVGNPGDATSIEISYSDVRSGNENVICQSGCTVNWGQGNIDLDPNFVSTGYLSTTKTYTGGDYHLLEGSPCIDAGDPSFVVGPDETDIDGNPRISNARVDIGADEVESPIAAIVKVTPNTLKPNDRHGKWITCHISLPSDYDISEVDLDSITLNEGIEPTSSKIDEDEQKLLVKFNQSEIQQMINDSQEQLSLTIKGRLNNGTDFTGTDTIRIVRKGNNK